MNFYTKRAAALDEQIKALKDEVEGYATRAEAEERDVTDEERAEADAKLAEAVVLREQYDDAVQRAQDLDALAERAEVPGAREDEDAAKERFNVNVKTDPFDLSDLPSEPHARFADLNARTITHIEGARVFLEDDHKESATQVMERTYGAAAEQTLLSLSPEYNSAWHKTMAGEPHSMTDRERAVMAEVDAIVHGHRGGADFFAADASTRALNVTDNVTAKLVPAHLDPSVIIANSGAANPFRQIARVIPITTNVWTGVTSAGITFGWTGTDASEVGDDSPSFSNPTVQACMWDVFIPISFQAYADWGRADAELARLAGDAYDRGTAQSFATGSGTNEPFGIVTALAGTSSNRVMATNSAFTLVDLLGAKNALGRRYRPNARWVANEIWGDNVRQFGTNEGSLYTVDLNSERPDRILGKPFLDSSGMTALQTSATTNHAFVYGDFDNYVIVERVGTTMEFIPHLFHTNANRPSLQRGLLWYGRTGADSVNDGGFVLLTQPKAT